MATVGKFEDLEVWKVARVLTNKVYDLTDIGRFSKDFGLRDQIRRASVSVLSNISEGFERETDADFGHFLSIARGSAAEVKAQLYIALDRHYIDESSFCDTAEQCSHLSHLLSNFIRYLKRQPHLRAPNLSKAVRRAAPAAQTAASGGQTPAQPADASKASRPSHD